MLTSAESCFLGIEFGSTRIKAVLIDEEHRPVAAGVHDWENRFENGLWTYSEEDILLGLQSCYKSLCGDVKSRYGFTITTLGGIGVSAMMHGYMAFGADGRLLVPFRTWRNTSTAEAAELLSREFAFNIPQRWSIAHLYQAILNGEAHVGGIEYVTTLAGYIHWRLTGERLLGIGDASGMFPIDTEKGAYDGVMLGKFEALAGKNGFSKKLADILPRVLPAGENAGELSADGARLLDPSGSLIAGSPLCPPEGDAGTGMVATDSVAMRSGNVSAGTSIFAMVVLEKPLAKPCAELDIVTTPDGKPVAMVHCNNFTSDINAYAGLFSDFCAALKLKADIGLIYSSMFEEALKGDSDCGKLLGYNYFSGEPITGLTEGRPLLVRMPDSSFTFANLMKSLMFSATATLKLGMDILAAEDVKIDRLVGHGGFFKSALPAQRFMSAALGAPVTVMSTAGEGGPWGMAALAAYMRQRNENESLDAYLERAVFAEQSSSTVSADENDRADFGRYIKRYTEGLSIEKAAIEALR